MALLEHFLQTAQQANIRPAATEDDFKAAREGLVASGQAIKGSAAGLQDVIAKHAGAAATTVMHDGAVTEA